MIIGVPKEIMSGEDRVAATPETVADMVGKGLMFRPELRWLAIPKKSTSGRT